MRIKAQFKKGRLTYTIKLVNVWVDPCNGRREFKDQLTGDWVEERYIRKPILLEEPKNDRRPRMVSAVRNLFVSCGFSGR